VICYLLPPDLLEDPLEDDLPDMLPELLDPDEEDLYVELLLDCVELDLE